MDQHFYHLEYISRAQKADVDWLNQKASKHGLGNPFTWENIFESSDVDTMRQVWSRTGGKEALLETYLALVNNQMPSWAELGVSQDPYWPLHLMDQLLLELDPPHEPTTSLLEDIEQAKRNAENRRIWGDLTFHFFGFQPPLKEIAALWWYSPNDFPPKNVRSACYPDILRQLWTWALSLDRREAGKSFRPSMLLAFLNLHKAISQFMNTPPWDDGKNEWTIGWQERLSRTIALRDAALDVLGTVAFVDVTDDPLSRDRLSDFLKLFPARLPLYTSSSTNPLPEEHYHFFICHASEDKASVVIPLAEELKKLHFKVWVDKWVLTCGDSLSGKIDEGLRSSRYGIVILSKSFFAKNWPKTELEALTTRQINEGRKIILPIWHDVSVEDVNAHSVLLSDKIALKMSDGLPNVIKGLRAAIGYIEI